MSVPAPAAGTPSDAPAPGTTTDTKWYPFFIPASLVLLLLDLWDAISAGPLTPVSVTLLISLAVALLTTGFHLRIGGTLFLALLAIAIIVPNGIASVFFMSVGAYTIAGAWIARGWYFSAAAAIAVPEALAFLNAANPWADLSVRLTGIAFGTFIVIAGGIGVQRLTRDSAELRHRIAQAEKERRDAARSVHAALAAGLHDTVATDLVRVIVSSTTLAKRTTDPQVREDLAEITALTRDAMTHLRVLMDNAGISHSVQDENIDEVLDTCRTMLAQRDIRLDVHSTLDTTRLPARERAILAAALREGSTNALKYAAASTRMDITIEDDEVTGTALTLVTTMDPRAPEHAAGLSGGFGLDNLESKVLRAGGSFSAGDVGEEWILSLSLPHHHDQEDQEEHHP